jgi:hypothetical protein
MTAKRTRKIRITATRTRTLRLQAQAVNTYCPACASEVGTLNMAEAAEFLEIELPALYQFIAEGRLHPISTVSGSLRVCQNSLFCKESNS